MTRPRVSAIVSNRNGARFLPRLLASLAAQRDIEVQIIVIDRHSDDASRAILAAHPDIVVIEEPPETGLVAGYTRGLASAVHPLLFFANEDMYFADDCLRRLADALDLSRRIAAADPWQWSYDGSRLIHGGTRFVDARLDVHSPWLFAHEDPLVPLPSGADVPFGCAASLLIDRGIFDQVGGWDTSFFLDYEDMDLGIRLWQQGWRTVHVPEARVFHAWGASDGQPLVPGMSVSQRRRVSARANTAMIGVKYYSGLLVLLPLGTWIVRVAAALLRLRAGAFRLELRVAGEMVRRLPAALRWRRLHRADIRRAPGQRFFQQREFRAGAKALSIHG